MAPRPVSLNPAGRGLEIGFLDDPQWHNFTQSKSAHQEVVGVLDQACAIWGLAGGDGRSRFIQHCLRYGLLSLLDAGVLEFPDAADPEFVRHYREMEAQLSAAGASAIFTSPGFCSSAWAMGCSGADGTVSRARASRPSWVNPVLHRHLPAP